MHLFQNGWRKKINFSSQVDGELAQINYSHSAEYRAKEDIV